MARRNTNPRCLNCGKRLPRYAYRVGGPHPHDAADPKRQFGGYGDNRFCGLNCGYRWALMYLDHHGEYEVTLRRAMEEHMAREEAKGRAP